MTIGSDREDARLFDLPHYYGANACPKPGHGNVKRTSNKQCHQCGLEYERQKRANADEEKRERERIRKREAKRAGLWVREDPVKKAARERSVRAKAAAMPEAIERRRQQALQRDRDRAARHMAREAERARLKEEKRLAKLSRCLSSIAAKKALRRERERTAPGSHTDEDARDLLLSQGGRCAYCGSEYKPTKDHKYPLALGGSNDIGNIQWLCKPDNSRKGAIPDGDYRQRIGVPMVTPWDGHIGRLLWLGLAAAA